MVDVITIETPSLGDRSYVVHDGTDALVIDPQRDIDRVLDAVADAGITVSHVAETHVHNDYVTGGLVLSRVTGARYLHADAEELSFDHEPVSDGDTFAVGTMTVEVVATPGHTAHHLSYVVRDPDGPDHAFTGGSQLLGSVGRTDLVAEERTEELTRLQHRSARRLADLLDDSTCIHPTHGFGSFCSSASSDDESDGTMATERSVNVALTVDDEDEFVDRLVSGLSAYPRYYVHMDPLNRSGPGPIDLSLPRAVDPPELARRIHRGEWVIDVRTRKAFAAEHLTGTVGIELDDPFATYVGWLLPWGTPLTLVGDAHEQIQEAQRQLARIGIDRPTGAAHGEIDDWAGSGDRGRYDVVDFAGLADARRSGGAGTVLDVRRDDEWQESHLAGAAHVAIHDLLNSLDVLPEGELWVHCASGFRASIATSLLDRAGFDVVLIDDDFDHAEEAGLDLVVDDRA